VGERVPEDQKKNFPGHARIAERSPVRPLAGGEHSTGVTDLVRQDWLEGYLYRLNRHPGRRVDVKLAAAEADPGAAGRDEGEVGGGLALEYMVMEEKPWLVLFQGSNTGTKSTDEWKETFAFVNNQLTGRDDILSVSYSTAAFKQSHAVGVSYEAPFFDCDRLRFAVNASYSEFQASDVGRPDEVFFGDSSSAGGRLIADVFQDRGFFIDVYAELQWYRIHVRNEKFSPVVLEDWDGFLLPGFGVQCERNRLRDSLTGTVGFSFNLPDVAGTSFSDNVNQSSFGRQAVGEHWESLSWDVRYGFYLEPLIDYRAWADVSDPAGSTLAHEVLVSCRGQYSFGHRLVPQFTQTVGGLYSVRGYRQSQASGDDMALISGEYRYHLPRSLRPRPEPGALFGQPFRYAPKQVFGPVDWDFILKAFVDAGRTVSSDRIHGVENDETLVGVGVGTELQLKRNISVRVDVGWALDEVDQTDVGDSEVHFVGTILY
jgi:hemolysin activation/secretion protein